MEKTETETSANEFGERERLFRRDGFGENYASTTPLVF